MKLPLALVLLAAPLSVGCADLTAPSPYRPRAEGSAAPSPAMTTATAAAQPAPAPTPAPRDPKAALTRIKASHILIAYQGARRSNATRPKAEAKKIAEQVLARIRGGADFAKLARDFSDDTGNKQLGGDLGMFDKNTMAKPFTDAAFALDVNNTSDVVETEFGFHIIKRTE